jgi:hypothetical protein
MTSKLIGMLILMASLVFMFFTLAEPSKHENGHEIVAMFVFVCVIITTLLIELNIETLNKVNNDVK